IRTIISKELNVDISLKDFLANNTIEMLSSLIKKGYKSSKIEYPELVVDKKNMYEPFPLTEVQTAYLMGRESIFEMGGISTHVYLELNTELDVNKFNIALNKVIKRHHMLRTIIMPTGRQQILKNIPEYSMQIVDISNKEPDEQKKDILKERVRMSHFVFKTDQWPLFEYKAFKLSEKVNYLFVGYDMLITDGSSFQIIHKEIMDCYNNEKLELPELNITFRDYIITYNKFKNSEVYKSDKAYWIDKLEDFPSAPILPYKNNPEDIIKPHFNRKEMTLNREIYAKLKKKANKYNVTTSAILCSAFAKILSFASNQTHFALNCTIFNRLPIHDDIMNLVGDFTSVMLLDINIDKEQSIWDNVKSTQEVMMDALERRHYDGIEFIRELVRYKKLDTNKAIMPIVFTSMLIDIGKEYEKDSMDMGTVEMSVSQTSQVFLDYQVMEKDGELSISWDYVEDLFEQDLIDDMFTKYFEIIEAFIEEKNQYKLKCSKNNAVEIEAYNESDEEIQIDTLDNLFVNQAKKTPEAIALINDNEKITYKELDEKSNQVANYLLAQGVKRNDYVGVVGSRSIESIINVLGILKAGAAYLPMDPSYPEERVNYILEKANSKLLLDNSIKNISKEYSYLDINIERSVDDVAYVIFTSGSTGKPKGVVINHKAACNTIKDINGKFDVNHRDKFIGISSMCFDLSVYDIFGSLSTGATLYIIPDQRDIQNIKSIIEKNKITVWNSVPAIMELLMDSILENEFLEGGYKDVECARTNNDVQIIRKNSSLRLILLSGDWIPIRLPDKINEHFINAYSISLGGATEASIWSIYYPIEEVYEDSKSIPYGIPLANQKIHVLNYEDESCPIEVPGELYIGGAGLANGYLNDDAKSKDAFIKNEKYGRLYRTGDFGVLRKDGYVEFLGRKDKQIKVRGYRVELGEIKNNIDSYSEIKESIVVCKTDVRNSKYICAYIVSNKKVNIDELKEYLGKNLPNYMIPTHIIQIKEIPITKNGKVDYQSLQEKEIITVREFIAPKTEMEKMISKIWLEILNVEQIGTNENLFELGADSTSIIKFVATMSTKYGIKSTIQQIFKTPNIREISKSVGIAEENINSKFSKELMLLNDDNGKNKKIFCFPPVVALGVVYQKLAEILQEYSIYSFNFIEDENKIDEYIKIIKEVQKEGPYTFLGISAGGNLAFEITKIMESRGDIVNEIVLLDSFYIDEINPNRLTEKESLQYANETVDLMLEQYPKLKSEDGVFEQYVVEKIRSYYRYLDDLINVGEVNANLNIIKSTSGTLKQIRGDINQWNHCTNGKCTFVNGYGNHEKMLDQGYVEKNAELIRNIIK
ncbi:amino acid adenylation domain-containing protein, partial [Clostridium gasigenes]|uniref:non-ribosomal peptide synthetase n=1 Tax=Clostridium gasigenes TaxID=94869 RepID=UPI001627F58E